MPYEFLKEIAQFGFAAVVAFIMIYLMWKIVHYGIDAFKILEQDHKEDMLRLHDLHREERTECYAKQERQIEKFDSTIKMVIDKLK